MTYIKLFPPKRKADWKGRMLRLVAVPPSCRYDYGKEMDIPQLPIQPGDVVRLARRRDISEVNWVMSPEQMASFGKRVLEIEWQCPHCCHPHSLIIPEAWVEEGKAYFVEDSND